MLEIKSVACKNFLSYGNKWNKIDLYKGINLVIGYDIQKQRSNGAGKTSFMEIISFALFGSVSKGLKKSQIINWKNKKACEVKVIFEKNGIEYTFHRGIKPNFIKVYKGENEYPINASVKEFQLELEEQLIGMDFKVFNSLIYSNPNNSISLLDTPKAQKRAFIEKQFNLTEFSALNKLNNECIKTVELELHDSEKQIETIKGTVDDLILEIANIKDEKNDIDIDSIITQEKEYKLKLEEVKDVTDDGLKKIKDDLLKIREENQKIQEQLINVTDKKAEVKEKLVKQLTQIKSLKKQKKDIGDISLKIKEADKIRNKLKFYDDIEEKLKIKKDGLPDIKKQLKNLQENINDHNNIIKEHSIKIKSLNIDNLKGKAVCPTCHQNVEYDVIIEQLKEQIDEHQSYINKEEEIKQIVVNSFEEMNTSLKQREEDIEILEEKVKKKNKLTLELTKLEAYAEKQTKLDEIEKELKKLNSYKKDVKILDDYDKLLKIIIKKKDTYKDSIKKLEQTIENKEELLIKKNDINKRIDILFEVKLNAKNTIKKCEERIKVKSQKVVKLNNQINENSIDIIEKTKELEHFKYVKTMLKDENIKQFAISNMIPIIEKKANYYLGEAGFGFYLKLDNWIDAEIKGPGITDCSFASMSGGERKSIDLALKFAIMDISMVRITMFPDVLILDELLDSSVDSYGIKQLIDIIKVKQKKNNLKIFLISHRQEMEELEPDNIYKIIKDNGYSSMEILK